MFSLTKEAMAILTTEQRDALVRIANDAVDHVKVMIDFSLPSGYIYFVQQYADNRAIHGGIAPNGDVST